MANRQTRFLATKEKGTRMLKGQQHPNNRHSSYAVIVERPIYRGAACDTSFANAPGNGNKRRHAHQYKPDPNMSLRIQHEMLGLTRRVSNG